MTIKDTPLFPKANMLKDSTYYLDIDSHTDVRLARGVLCGLVGCLMAQGFEFQTSLNMLAPYLPANLNWDAVPDGWVMAVSIAKAQVA